MRNQDEFFGGKPVRIPKALRDELEAAIQAHLTAVEKLTAVLDKADGNPDLEPSMGSYLYGTPAHLMDREQDAGEEPENTWRETHGKGAAGDSGHHDDYEPSLTHTNDVNQVRARENLTRCWSGWGSTDHDLEDEHDGREPSLGAPERNFAGAYRSSFSQERWADGATDDRENDGDDLEPDVDDEPNRCPAVMP